MVDPKCFNIDGLKGDIMSCVGILTFIAGVYLIWLIGNKLEKDNDITLCRLYHKLCQ